MRWCPRVSALMGIFFMVMVVCRLRVPVIVMGRCTRMSGMVVGVLFMMAVVW
jgi:hypothetical protein